MDRFIEILYEYKQTLNVYLKSNMDRFIGNNISGNVLSKRNLKSNMDRFIGHRVEEEKEGYNI